jgi:signal transduction histidine kinase
MAASATRAATREVSSAPNQRQIAGRSPCACGELDAARRELAIATQQALQERERRTRLEHTLHDEVGQELAGIALMLGAARRPPYAKAGDREAILQDIAALLAATIGRCVRLTRRS